MKKWRGTLICLALLLAGFLVCVGGASAADDELSGEQAPYAYRDGRVTVYGTAFRGLESVWELEALDYGIQEFQLASGMHKTFSITEGLLIDTRRSTVVLALTTLERVTIPDGVRRIENYAFACNPNLREITLPDSLREIGEGAFRRCFHLEEITVPPKVYSIGSYAFEECIRLRACVLPEAMRVLPYGVFSGCTALETVDLPQINRIEDEAFFGCVSLGEITLPARLRTIGAYAFYRCLNLQNVAIPKLVTRIGPNAFGGCLAMTAIEVPRLVRFDDIHQRVDSDQTTGVFCQSSIRTIVFDGDETNITNVLFHNDNWDNLFEYISVEYLVFKKGPPRRYDLDEFTKLPKLKTICYTAKYRKAWAPNGETEWNGLPIEEITEERLTELLALPRQKIMPLDYVGDDLNFCSESRIRSPLNIDCGDRRVIITDENKYYAIRHDGQTPFMGTDAARGDRLIEKATGSVVWEL